MTATQNRTDTVKYRTQEYWDERFEEEAENVEGSHEWFSSYQTFANLVTLVCPPTSTHTILVPGNGNSTLSFDLISDYPDSKITGSDFSPAVIRHMSHKYAEHSQRLNWLLGDFRDIQEEQTYDLVLEKGVIDALVAGSRSPYAQHLDEECLNDVERALESVRKSLVPCTGCFLSISFASPLIRLKLLEGVFTVRVHSFLSPNTSFEYYMYECRNKEDPNDSNFYKYLKSESSVLIETVSLPENDISTLSADLFS